MTNRFICSDKISGYACGSILFTKKDVFAPEPKENPFFGWNGYSFVCSSFEPSIRQIRKAIAKEPSISKVCIYVPLPGTTGGKPLKYEEGIITPKNLHAALVADNFVPCNYQKANQIPNGYNWIKVCCSPKDYCFYLYDTPTKTWKYKDGWGSSVSNRDNSGNIIFDPLKPYLGRFSDFTCAHIGSYIRSRKEPLLNIIVKDESGKILFGHEPTLPPHPVRWAVGEQNRASVMPR